ncbi:EF-Tu/IF-2/RF-3 family GTPase [Streptomyces sp. RPT161]|uniref:EF-Tu C-terminal domain-related protein n=1 Tax=Streptomyces sp. RPT161 TaxID=3015993 RepID=UPI0022B917F5|nr:EF-Tu/IF-2/RF-3 family GTPase [Streptomyces sp. RPT161]
MNPVETPFLMVVEDVFRLNQGRVIMATGPIERGRVRTGDEVATVGFHGGAIACVTGIEAFRLRVEEASAGMNVALLLPGATAGAVERGQVLAAPGSVDAHTAFGADIALLSEEQGGGEVRTGERLDFYIRAGGVKGVVALPRKMDALQPLHQAAVRVTLDRPVALEPGQSFAFRLHGRAAGSGTVTQLLH